MERREAIGGAAYYSPDPMRPSVTRAVLVLLAAAWGALADAGLMVLVSAEQEPLVHDLVGFIGDARLHLVCGAPAPSLTVAPTASPFRCW
jgi:hypothetical protein